MSPSSRTRRTRPRITTYPRAPKAATAIKLWAEKRAQLENGEINVNEYEDWKASL